MAATITQLLAELKEHRAILSRIAEQQGTIRSVRRTTKTTLDTAPIVAAINTTNGHVDGLDALLVTIDSVIDLLLVDSNAMVVDLAAMEILLIEIESEAQQIRVNVDNTGGKSIADWLSDAESSLNTLIAENAADFALNIAEIAVQGAAIIVAVVANAVSIVASVAIGNARLSDIKTAVEAIDVNTDGIEGGLQDIETLLVGIDQDTNSIRASADEIEAAVETIEANAGTWQGMSIGQAITAGHIVLSTPNGNGTAVVASVDNVQYTEPAGTPVAFLIRLDASKAIILDNSMWELSANVSPATITGIINNINILATMFTFHTASAGTSQASVLNGTSGSFHLSQRDRLHINSTGNPLAVAEVLTWAATVKVWVPAV